MASYLVELLESHLREGDGGFNRCNSAIGISLLETALGGLKRRFRMKSEEQFKNCAVT